MGAFVDLASDLKVPLVEDCAQAHGAAYRGDRIGSFGDIACFSFYPTKNMTTGEGGIVLTDRPEVADAPSGSPITAERTTAPTRPSATTSG